MTHYHLFLFCEISYIWHEEGQSPVNLVNYVNDLRQELTVTTKEIRMNTQIRKHFKGTIQQYVFEVMNKTLCDEKGMRVRLIVFDAIFNNISVISWWSVLFLEETGVPGENDRPVASD